MFFVVNIITVCRHFHFIKMRVAQKHNETWIGPFLANTLLMICHGPKKDN